MRNIKAINERLYFYGQILIYCCKQIQKTFNTNQLLPLALHRSKTMDTHLNELLDMKTLWCRLLREI